jgi:chloramphenicol-sensitive protein RarD
MLLFGMLSPASGSSPDTYFSIALFMRKGMLYAALAFFCWGLFPLYFKMLQSVPSLQILTHRMLWSLVFLGLVLAWRRQWDWIGQVTRQPRVVAGFAASALLLSSNWFLYIWAINDGRIVDASLGYFINPLINVMLGFLFLKERMRPAQWAAVALAAAGVAWLTWQAGQLPWIALLLAGSFGTYGLLRKTAALGALEGLSFETLLLLPLALGYTIWLSYHGGNAFVSATPKVQWLLAAAGPITAIPLLLFAAGARLIPLSVLGLLQYIGPTMQLLIGVWVFNEPFTPQRLVGFVVIWTALALYSAEGIWRARSQAHARNDAKLESNSTIGAT